MSRDRAADARAATEWPAEADLADALRAGEPEAFAELHRRYLGTVYSYLARRMDRKQDAEDLTCEVFLGAVTSAAGYRGRSGLKPWLLGIARRKLADWLRREARRQKVFATEPAAEDQEPPSGDPSPEQFVAKDEVGQQVRAAVRGLPASEREALLLHTCEELDLASVGAAMGRSPNAVKCLLRRARDRLRERLTPLQDPSPGVAE